MLTIDNKTLANATPIRLLVWAGIVAAVWFLAPYIIIGLLGLAAWRAYNAPRG